MIEMKKRAAEVGKHDELSATTAYLQKTILSEAKLVERELKRLSLDDSKPMTAAHYNLPPGHSPMLVCQDRQ